MAKRWHIRSHDPVSIASLQRAAGVPDVVAQLLICRGITDPAKARSFLDPKLSDLYDPETLPGCREAAQRIHAAVQAKQRIVIYGDYDVDGMSGTAVLYLCLKLLGAEVSYYVPHRVDEGYGLNCEAVRSWGNGRASLMITVDCGISGVDEAVAARECGLELIITDHHTIGPQLPEAAAIVHPQLPGDYPFSGLSGSGVALKAGLGAVPAGQRGAKGQSADAGFPGPSGRFGGPGHRGRRRAAGGRESRARAPWTGESRPLPDAGAGDAHEDCQDRAQDQRRRHSTPSVPG